MTSDPEFIPTIAVVRISGDLGGMSADDANKVFIGVISEIAKGCAAAGAAAIGHIKANFNSGDELLSLSCTTENGNVRSKSVFANKVGDYTSIVNVIVYGIEYDVMCSVTERAIGTIPGRKDVSFIDSDSCADPNCHDPDCKDPAHRIVTIG